MLMDAVHDFILHFFPNEAANGEKEQTAARSAAQTTKVLARRTLVTAL
jgi:hypothetical protein